MRRIAVVIAGGSVLTFVQGCGEVVNGELPPVAEVVGYDVVRMDWPWCAVEPPPVRSDSDVCPISEMGERIDPERVCRLVVGLKVWMENPPPQHPAQLEHGDWHRIRSVIVCGWGVPRVSSSKRGANAKPVIHIEVDMGEGRRMFWADLEEEASPPMTFGDTHR
jgi:hypothetical protein